MVNQKHIALVLPALNGGGAERVALTLASQFAKRKWKVDLVVFKSQGSFINSIPKNVNVIAFDAEDNKKATLALSKYLLKARPEHAIGFLYPACFALAIARGFFSRGTKIWLRLDNTLSAQISEMSRLKVKRIKKYFPKADGIIAVSKGVEDDYKAYMKQPNTNVHTIYNPIPVDEIQMLAKSETADKFTWQNPDLPLLVSMGRLSKQKDFSTLLKTLTALNRSRLCNLLILGTGSERDALQLEVNELGLAKYVIFGGFQENPYPYLKQASLFILPSKYEGFGNVLVEAMACGTPVISTHCPNGPAEILANGTFGPLVEPKNPIAMANNILAYLSNPIDANTLKSRARNFDSSTIADQYEALLASA